jgi:hypothetical protein
MKIRNQNFEGSENELLEIPLVYFIYFLALSTIVLMIGLQASARFSTVSFFIVGALVAAAIPLLFSIRTLIKSGKINEINIRFIILSLLVFIGAGVMSASINRPDIDDSIYAPKAVFYTEHKSEVLNKTVSWLAGLPDKPLSIVFNYYEIIQASLASFFGMRFLDLYHIAFPAIVGFLMCLSMLLIISIFDQSRWMQVLGVLFFTLLLLLLGETHRTFGNISIARAFHGKFMFMSVGVPAWIYFSLQFLVLQRLRSWLVLLAIGVGMVGATTTAMVFLPLLSILLVFSHFINEGKIFSKKNALLAIKYLSSLTPVLLIALNFRIVAKSTFPAGSAVYAGFPLTFSGQLRLLINPDYPLTPIIFIVSLALVLAFSEYRRFFAAWVLLAIIFFLNPFVSDFVIKNITTENLYWRLFYLLPFPVLSVIALTSLINKRKLSKSIIFILISVTFYFSIWGPTSVIRAGNGAHLGMPGYKIHEPEISVIREIAEHFPEGSMFAPLEISSNILIYSSKYPQFHIRADSLEFILKREGMDSDLADRSKSFNYLYQNNNDHEDRLAFERIIKSVKSPDYFVAYANSPKINQIRDTLLANNYSEASISNSNYLVFSRVPGL